MEIDTTTLTLTKEERSMLLYAEECLVNNGGLLVCERMNAADMTAMEKFKAAGLLDYGRIPAKVLGVMIQPGAGLHLTHWVTFNESGWQAAHALRRARSLQLGPNRKKVNEFLAERAEVPA